MLTDHESALGHAKKPVRIIWILFFLVFVVFGGWAATARLDSASAAPGKIITENKTQSIAHTYGGQLQTLHVKEGDVVEVGDLLIEFNPTQPESTLKRYAGEFSRFSATKARLEAEEDNYRDPVFPDSVIDTQAASQLKLFNVRKRNFLGKTAILDEKITQIMLEIEGYKQRQIALKQQMRLNDKEISSYAPLVTQGHGTRSNLNAMQTRKAELQERAYEMQTLLTTARQRISEAKLEKLDLQNDISAENSAELKDVIAELNGITEQLVAAADMLEQTRILAPVSGRIAHIKYRTPGSAVPANVEIMALVPEDEEKVAEVRINPQDIDVVQVGMPGRINISAYKANSLPPLDGVLKRISADSIQDDTTGETYYTAEISILPESLSLLPEGKALQPGMLVDAMIVTGERTPLQYLWDPVKTSFRKALNED